MRRAARPLALAGLAALLLDLSGCGKKSEPEPPGPAGAIIYPRPYPPPP